MKIEKAWNSTRPLASSIDQTHFHRRMNKYRFLLRYLLIENMFVYCAVRHFKPSVIYLMLMKCCNTSASHLMVTNIKTIFQMTKYILKINNSFYRLMFQDYNFPVRNAIQCTVCLSIRLIAQTNVFSWNKWKCIVLLPAVWKKCCSTASFVVLVPMDGLFGSKRFIPLESNAQLDGIQKPHRETDKASP